jgi:hypothetical protein
LCQRSRGDMDKIGDFNSACGLRYQPSILPIIPRSKELRDKRLK